MTSNIQGGGVTPQPIHDLAALGSLRLKGNDEAFKEAFSSSPLPKTPQPRGPTAKIDYTALAEKVESAKACKAYSIANKLLSTGSAGLLSVSRFFFGEATEKILTAEKAKIDAMQTFLNNTTVGDIIHLDLIASQGAKDGERLSEDNRDILVATMRIVEGGIAVATPAAKEKLAAAEAQARGKTVDAQYEPAFKEWINKDTQATLLLNNKVALKGSVLKAYTDEFFKGIASQTQRLQEKHNEIKANMPTCTSSTEAYEKQLARIKDLKNMTSDLKNTLEGANKSVKNEKEAAAKAQGEAAKAAEAERRANMTAGERDLWGGKD